MRRIKNRAFSTTFIIVLALLMMLSVALSVSATDNAEIQVTATTDLSVNQGENGICYVCIDSLEKLSSLIVTVHYDTNKVDVKVGNVFNVAHSLLHDKVVKQDGVQFSYIFDGNGSATQAQLFYFEYTVLANAQDGGTYFDVVVSEAYDSSLTALPVVGSRCNFSIVSSPSVETHSYTRRIVTEVYKKSDATCTLPAMYYYCCETCDAVGTETFEHDEALGHTGGIATCSEKATCTRCGQLYGDMLPHVYTDEDATPTYLKSAATCSSGALYYKNCATCDMAGTESFEYGARKKHKYTNACDNDCNACGQIRSVDHSYLAEWSKDAESHWYECSVCGDKKEHDAHIPGADATETTDQVCTACGYVIQEALGHTHSYSIPRNDEVNHWKECVCGDKADTANHVWDGGVMTKDATYEEEGEKTYTCTDCLYTKRESVEKLILPEPEEILPETSVETESDVIAGDESISVETESDVIAGDESISVETESDVIAGDESISDADKKGSDSIVLIGAMIFVALIVVIVLCVLRKARTKD